MTPGSALANVQAALKRHGSRVQSHGGYYTAQCPAHGDQTPSLSFSQGDKGVRMKCHTGCEVDDIRIALELSWPDLFDKDSTEEGRHTAADLWMPCQRNGCGGHKSAEYRYTDEYGRLLYAVARCSRKGDGCPAPFAQWHPDPSKKYGKKWGLPSHIRRVLYDLPRVLEAARAGRRIYLIEGEKDVERMKADFPDEVATSADSGAGKSKWRREFTRYFAGASEVVIIADCDTTGLGYAEEAHHHISKVVDKVTVVCSPLMENGADFSDHRDYGYGLDEFQVVPFETVERRPEMVIRVEKHHTEEPVVFKGYDQKGLECALVGAMLRYGVNYEINEGDLRSNDKLLKVTAGAISRLAARGSAILPETVAAQIEEEGISTYDKAYPFLVELEKGAFSDTEKPKRAAGILRNRSARCGITFSLEAAKEALRDERRSIPELLAHMRRLTDAHEEEYVELARRFNTPAETAFEGDLVAEVAREEGITTQEVSGNVRELRPRISLSRERAVQGG